MLARQWNCSFEKHTIQYLHLQCNMCLVWLLFYAHRHRSILGAAGHIILTPANQLMEEQGPYNSEPPEQSCLLRWTEKIASLCFGPSGDRTPYLLIRSRTLIDCATGPGLHVHFHLLWGDGSRVIVYKVMTQGKDVLMLIFVVV
jgi:hypothetical protein